ncbi:MAG: hypothetical protein ACRBN8_04085 [Nannocystales bacterium]
MSRRCSLGAALFFGACIIPDRGIQLEGGPSNPGAVRILKPTLVPEQWTQWCDDIDTDAVIEDGTSAFCPQVRATRPGGLVDQGTFCVCPQGQWDTDAPELWTIYAEDPDLDGDDPEDTLYGVLLLDPDPLSEQPTAAVAFQNYLEPCAPGAPISPEEVRKPVSTASEAERTFIERVVPSIGRNPAPQWAFEIDDAVSDHIDLCNNNNGNPLPLGLHNLQFMVTDRPFFRASRDDSDLQREQCGVPDVAAGATYAVTNYVFECLDGTLEENDGICGCEDEE